MKTVIVTRHHALVEYLREVTDLPEHAAVIAHATETDVKGAHIYGVLPLRLAALAERITEIPLDLPPELRGVELSVEQVRKYAGAMRSYTVASVDA